jgi:hypothetical protein
MHGFAKPTIAMSRADAITVKAKSGQGNVVEKRMLQFQHSFGNGLLAEIKEGLMQGQRLASDRPAFQASAAEKSAS